MAAPSIREEEEEGEEDERTASSSTAAEGAASSSSAAASEAGDAPDPAALRCLRSLVFSTNVLNNLSLGCTAPFLQHHLEVYYNEGYSSAGRIFAVFPLAALLCSPGASWMCRRLGKGKFGVWQLGLLVSVASAFMFGCSKSVAAFFLFRGLQGLGFALTTVSALGLLIERSPDLTADIGRQEMLVGLSFVFAPAIGGLLYTYVGFASIFLLLSLAFAVVALLLAGALRSGMLSPPRSSRSRSAGSMAAAAAVGGGCLLQAVCCPLRGCGGGRARQRRQGGPALHLDESESEGEEEEAARQQGQGQGQGGVLLDDDDDEERGRRAPLLAKARIDGTGEGEDEGEEAGGVAIGLWSMLRVPGVLAACLVVLMSFHTIGFLELTMSGHAKASLRLPPLAVGLLFSAVDASYALTGYCLPRVRQYLGGCRPLALAGLGLQTAAFVVLGPVPTPWSNRGGAGAGVADGVLAWGSVVLGCLLTGCGEGLSIIPAVDLMRMALPVELVGPCGGDDDERVTASLAALMSAFTSFGEFLGPMLGGYLMMWMPRVEEVGCLPSEQEDGDCRSSFRWATTAVAVALLGALGLCSLALSSNEQAVMTPRMGGSMALLGEEEEGAGAEGEGYRRLPAVEEGEEDDVAASATATGKAAAGATATATVAGVTPTRPARKPRGGSFSGSCSPSPKRPRSRPPTPISFASIRVPSSSTAYAHAQHPHAAPHEQQQQPPQQQHRRIRSAPSLQAMEAQQQEQEQEQAAATKATVVE